jgi:hypothetical protein
MPQIQFRFIVCSYLPGIPLAVAIYILWVKVHSGALTSNIDYFYISYFLIAPLFCGLVIDAARHFVEDFVERLLPNFFLFWKHIEFEAAKNLLNENGVDLLNEYNARCERYYYLYEFFLNALMSLLISFCIVAVGGKTPYRFWICSILILFATICFAMSTVFSSKLKKFNDALQR